MVNSARTTDVVIIGAGLVGAAQALALAKEGIKSIIIDREAPQSVMKAGYDGRVSAINKASISVYNYIGIWDDLKAQAQPIHDIRVLDEDSPASVHFDYRDVGKEPFGHMIANMQIRQTLLQHVIDEPLITLLAPMQVANMEQRSGDVLLTLDNDATISAPLILAADGRRSAMRDRLGISFRHITYDQSAIVVTIHHEKPHQGLALERFYPAGPLAQLPMTDNRSAIVWTEPTDQATAIMQLDDEAFKEELFCRLGGYLGDITLEGKRYSYPLMLVQADDYISHRAALIGDAAHSVHPIAGQGVNLGYRDVAVLTELLSDAKKRGQDLGSASLLEHYQRWRRFDAASMVAATDGLNRLFSTNRLPAKLLRRTGLAVFDRIKPVKQFFMLHAMGLKGDLPKMLREDAA